MTTNKTRRTKKRHSKKKDITKTRHRNRSHRSRHRNRSNRSSWKNHYTYESYAPETNNIVNGNNGNIVNGLRDFLALKKNKK
jgi:hypothetical protein